MAESQLVCLDDEHINETIPESRPQFYYSEQQRAALEQLLRNGDGAFKMRLKEDNIKDFLSAREIKGIRKTFQEYQYEGDGDGDKWECEPAAGSRGDSGVHSTYWPQLSDTEVPPLDIGWPDGGFYKGVCRVTVYSHPPRENGPHIKQLVAIVMDLLTDLQILQDLLDAASKRSVPVYIVLEATGIPHFLDMCSRLQVTATHLRNIRVRMLAGCGLSLSLGKLPGSLCTKYMLVDAEKVMFGSYSFTWTSSRTDRNLVTVMTGQVVDMFDNHFRELYAASDKVDLYKEFHIPQPPAVTPMRIAMPQKPPPLASASRFLGDPRPNHLKVPAHKYHNPKYSLVVGNSLGLTRSLQDLSALRESMARESQLKIGQTALQASSEKLDRMSPPPPVPGDTEDGANPAKPNGLSGKKQRSSSKHFSKGRSNNQNGLLDGKDTAAPSSPSPTHKAPESPDSQELEDKFEVVFAEKPALLKGKYKKPSKLGHRSVSLQAINSQGEEDFKGRRRHSKKVCIQS
ncbi:protein FAM83F-like [Scleropages formosus]|uniref:Protein FAM83F-like n=1 Tax=Scleropages formosus TaxID=113540 RepID=A0A0P7U127_SCLFO|nr:protein FAM83F-like [Scleropages formosus]